MSSPDHNVTVKLERTTMLSQRGVSATLCVVDELGLLDNRLSGNARVQIRAGALAREDTIDDSDVTPVVSHAGNHLDESRNVPVTLNVTKTRQSSPRSESTKGRVTFYRSDRRTVFSS